MIALSEITVQPDWYLPTFSLNTLAFIRQQHLQRKLLQRLIRAMHSGHHSNSTCPLQCQIVYSFPASGSAIVLCREKSKLIRVA